MLLKNHYVRHKTLYLSLISGFLLVLSWPPFGLPFIVFVAFVPLLFAERIVLCKKQEAKSAEFFRLAYLAFFVFNLLTTWWISFSTLAGMAVAVVLNSFFMATPWWLVHVWRRSSSKQGWLPLIFLWLSFEHLHSQWELSWSWLDIGNVFATTPAIVQWYEYTGVAGGTLWVLVVNLFAFSFLKEIKEMKGIHLPVWRTAGMFALPKRILSQKKTFLLFGFFLAFLFLPILGSLIIYWNYEERLKPLEVVIVQPSEDPYHQPSDQEKITIVDEMINLAAEQVTPNTSFVLSPEAALPHPLWLDRAETNQSLALIKGFLSQHNKLHWVTGATILQVHPKGEKLPFTARQIQNTSTYYTIFNSAIFLDRDRVLGHYHKSKLVPGIESIPFASVLRPLGWVFSKFGGTAKGMGKQSKRSVFEFNNGAVVAPVICFESIFGDYMTEYARLGANVIFIMTNDGWWGNTPGYRQHNHYARLRAIELRKPIARAASTGISSFIDQRGNFIQQTKWNQKIAIRQTLNLNDGLTYFALRGNIIGRTSLFFSALVLIAIFVQSVLGKKTEQV